MTDYSRLGKTTYTRQRMQDLHGVVIGAGALGNEAARLLGLLGAGKVSVVDPDLVESSNLPRSVFFAGGNSVGVNKAAALVAVAREMFRDTGWSAIGDEIAGVGFQCLANASLLFSCVDSDLARLEIAYISRRLRLPVVDAGLGAGNYSQGRVTYFPASAEHACFSCMLAPRKRRELLEHWEGTLRPCFGNGVSSEELNSTPTMASIVAAMQVELGLGTLFEAASCPEPSRSYEIQFHPERKMEEFSIPVSAECPFHQIDGELFALPNLDATFEDLLNSANADAVVLDWPICVEARCMDCNREWRPFQRVASLRRHGACPACGSRRWLELQSVRSVGRNSPWLHQSPSALQLPADHLYSLHKRSSS